MTRARPRLGRDTRGATVVEFALVLPIMIVTIMALMELSYQIYVQSMLTGAVQKAGRDSGIETNITGTAVVDQRVVSTMQAIASQATFAPSRRNFASFRQINRTGPEPFVDANNNGKRDKGECFDDINGNGVWDTQSTVDTGATGTGGAGDVVVYTMTMTYPRLFPLGAFLGWSDNQTLSSTTVLRNQPFASQSHAEQTICA